MNAMPSFISTLFDMGELAPEHIQTKDQAIEVIDMLEDRDLRRLMRPVWNQAVSLLTGKATIVVTPETQNKSITIVECDSLDDALAYLAQEAHEKPEPEPKQASPSGSNSTWDEWTEGTYDLLAIRPRLGFDRMNLVMYGSMTAYMVGEHLDEEGEPFWVLVTENLQLVTVQDKPRWAPSLHRDTPALYAKWKPKLEAYRCFLWPEHLRIQGLVTDENFRFDRHELMPSAEELQEMELRWQEFDDDVRQPQPADQETVNGIFAIALRQQAKHDIAWLEKQPRHEQYAEARRRLIRDVKLWNPRTGVGRIHTVLAQMLGKPPIVIYKGGRKLTHDEQKRENGGRYYKDEFIHGCRPWTPGTPVHHTTTPPAAQPKRFTTRKDCPRPTPRTVRPPRPVAPGTWVPSPGVLRINAAMPAGRVFYPDYDFTSEGTILQTSEMYLDEMEKLIRSAVNGSLSKLRAQRRKWAAEEAIEKLAAEEVHAILKPQEMARMAC